METFPFVVEAREVEPNINLVYFDIEDVSNAIAYLDSHIVTIFCGRQAEDEPEYAKTCLTNLFATKLNNESWLCGAVAEFFAHLLLNHKGYEQNFLYQNLEERSIKKGFDWVYSIEDELWLMESKSGRFN